MGCVQSSGPITVGSESGILSSMAATESNCGSTTSPWLIEGTSGQRVNVTLLDFGYPVDQGQKAAAACIPYGYMSERRLGVNKTICGGNSRQQVIYTSATSSVEVALKATGPDSPHFLVKFQGKFAYLMIRYRVY